MDVLLAFDNLKGSTRYLELISMHQKSEYEILVNNKNIVCCTCTESERKKINAAIDAGFSAYYSKEKKSFVLLNKPFICSRWDGYKFHTSPASANRELKKMLEFRNADKKTLLDKVIKIKFYIENFDDLADSDKNVFLYGKSFKLKDLEEYYQYMYDDFKDLVKRINDVKKQIDEMSMDELVLKKTELVKNLVLTSIKSDYEFGELTIEEIKNFYGEFINNMKELPFEIKFIPINKIKTNAYYLDEDLNNYEMSAEKNNNHYMKNNKTQKLAMDIFNNGTYWPLFVTMFSDLDYEIVEGNFRLGTLRSAQNQGLIPEDFEMLCVTNRLKSDFEKVTFKIPYVKDLGYMKNHTYYKFLYRCPNIERSECGKFYIVTFTRDYIESYGSSFAANSINMYGIGLNNYIFKYKLKPKELPGNDYINNKEKYKEYWNQRISDFYV